MLKNNDKNTETHFSYNEYRQKVKKGPNKDVVIFVSVFVIGLLIILGFVKILSPNVDIEIGSNDEYSQIEEDTYQNSVDDRLKLLQNEDANSNHEDLTMFSPELDEKVVLPKQKRKTSGEIEAEKQTEKLEEQEKIKEEAIKEREEHIKELRKHREQAMEEHNKELKRPPLPPKQQEASDQIVNAKVVVGYYTTSDQAEVAKTIIQDAGIGVTPITKNMGNYYTLQVGSYSSKEKAQQAANNLLKNNFPARVIIE